MITLTQENVFVTKASQSLQKRVVYLLQVFFTKLPISREKKKECRATCLPIYISVCVSLSPYIYPTQYINVPITHLPANPQTLHSIFSIQRNYQHLLSPCDHLSNSFKKDGVEIIKMQLYRFIKVLGIRAINIWTLVF